MANVGWGHQRQIYEIFIGKEDWVVERPREQIYAVLEINELWMREDINGYLFTILGGKIGWVHYTLWGSSTKREKLQN